MQNVAGRAGRRWPRRPCAPPPRSGPEWPVRFTAAHPVEVTRRRGPAAPGGRQPVGQRAGPHAAGDAATVRVDQDGRRPRSWCTTPGPACRPRRPRRVFERFYRVGPGPGPHQRRQRPRASPSSRPSWPPTAAPSRPTSAPGRGHDGHRAPPARRAVDPEVEAVGATGTAPTAEPGDRPARGRTATATQRAGSPSPPSTSPRLGLSARRPAEFTPGPQPTPRSRKPARHHARHDRPGSTARPRRSPPDPGRTSRSSCPSTTRRRTWRSGSPRCAPSSTSRSPSGRSSPSSTTPAPTTPTPWPPSSATPSPGVAAMHLPRKGRGYALRSAWSTSYGPGRRLHGRRPLHLALRPAPARRPAALGPPRRGHRLAAGPRRARRAWPKRELDLAGLQPAAQAHAARPLQRRPVRLQGAAPRRGRASCSPWSRTTSGSSTPSCWSPPSVWACASARCPVDWVDDPDSRVHIVSTAADDLRGVWRMLRPATQGAAPHPLATQVAADQLLRFAGVGVISTLGYLFLFIAWRPLLGALRRQRARPGHRHPLQHGGAPRALPRHRRAAAPGPASSPWPAGLYPVSLAFTTLGLLVAAVDRSRRSAARLVALTVANAVAAVFRFAVLRAWIFRRLAAPARRGRRSTSRLGGVPASDVTHAPAPDAPRGGRARPRPWPSSIRRPDRRVETVRRRRPLRRPRLARRPPARRPCVRLLPGQGERRALGAPRPAHAARRHRGPLPVGPGRQRVGQLLLLGRRAGRHEELEGLLLRFVGLVELHHRRQAAGVPVADGDLGPHLRAQLVERAGAAGARGRGHRRASSTCPSGAGSARRRRSSVARSSRSRRWRR